MRRMTRIPAAGPLEIKVRLEPAAREVNGQDRAIRARNCGNTPSMPQRWGVKAIGRSRVP
jgi:hypothetical protein